MTGTTANLVEGDVLNIEQLCYGMMLPSGNDAAYTLAEYFGNIIHEKKQSSSSSMPPTSFKSKFENTPVRHFLKECNSQAHKIGLTSSYYDSPHGLMNKSNYSTAEDQAILVSELMKLDFCRKVVNCIEFETTA